MIMRMAIYLFNHKSGMQITYLSEDSQNSKEAIEDCAFKINTTVRLLIRLYQSKIKQLSSTTDEANDSSEQRAFHQVHSYITNINSKAYDRISRIKNILAQDNRLKAETIQEISILQAALNAFLLKRTCIENKLSKITEEKHSLVKLFDIAFFMKAKRSYDSIKKGDNQLIENILVSFVNLIMYRNIDTMEAMV